MIVIQINKFITIGYHYRAIPTMLTSNILQHLSKNTFKKESNKNKVN